MKETKLSTDSYKGVRDFYPPEMFIEKYIFNVMRTTAERYGYVEYGASILEPTELYKSKTSEEIVNEQTYSFKDRGERDVTLRPEMTPTIARMVAAKRRDLAFPLRWYSIPNLFRYEKPQRGRLREHFQLNVDLFGVEDIAAEVEMLSLANDLMLAFGAKPSDFSIRVNSRKILRYILEGLCGLNDEHVRAVTRIIDQKEKITPHDFKSKITEFLGDRTEAFTSILDAKNVTEFNKLLLKEFSAEVPGKEELENLFMALEARGIVSAVFDPTLARGFDYYTGIVFEVFDTSPENQRSIFGGGRYDDLLSVFGSEKVPAVGFGMGDVVIKDFLETRGLLPQYRSSADLYICKIENTKDDDVFALAELLRKANVNVAIELNHKSIGDQIKTASKLFIPYIIVLGEDEISSGIFKLKNLASGDEQSVSRADLAAAILAGK